MRKSLSKDPVNPVLSEPHLEALDRRVNTILQTVRQCISQKSSQEVINFDGLWPNFSVNYIDFQIKPKIQFLSKEPKKPSEDLKNH